VEQHEELLILMITSFEGIKDVIKFMSFEELIIVGFQTTTKIEARADKSHLETSIGVGELGDDKSLEANDSITSESEPQESIQSELDSQNYKKIYERDRKKRLKIQNEKKIKNKEDLSAIVDRVRGRIEIIKATPEYTDKISGIESDTKSKGSSKYDKTKKRRGSHIINKIQKDSSVPSYARSVLGMPNHKKYADEISHFVTPDSINIDLNPGKI